MLVAVEIIGAGVVADIDVGPALVIVVSPEPVVEGME
jgi:hypothetical protein